MCFIKNMGKIQILPPHIANRIAAGEVIERPASIVKELLENAIDAGADSITVELQDGGRSLIRVIDNGCGIAFEDLALCIERHATSKIWNEAGLDAISTLGFRGEALPSIGAVSLLTIQSRPSESQSGGFVSISFGRDKRVGPIGCAPGTTVTVQDLFLELPARRRFLKGRQTELEHISMTIRRLAAAHPHIQMELWHEARCLFRFKKREPLKRMEPLLGHEFCSKLLAVCQEISEDYAIEMYLSPPEAATTHSRSFHLFLNGRPIRDAMLWKAITEAYKGLLMKGFFPVGGLFLRCNPSLVDVNVHPSKHEVRFAEQEKVYRMVYHGIKNALEAKPVFQTYQTVECHEELDAPSLFSNPPFCQVLETPETGWQTVLQQLKGQEQGTCSPMPAHTPSPNEGMEGMRIIDQLWHSYILVEMDQRLLVLDQHAAHEAIVFQRLRREMEHKTHRLQPLLVPLIVELGMEEMADLHELQPQLQELGVIVEPFGPFQIRVTALPHWFPNHVNKQALILNILRLLRKGAGTHQDEILYEHLASLACEEAVQAGQSLTKEEMQSLIQEVFETGVTRCPHGRPLFFQISRQELERLLGRR